jgi:protein TonB
MLLGFITISSAQTEEVIYQIVEQMPRFPGCEQLETKSKKENCSVNNLMEYVYSNLEYPEEAIKNKVEGRVVVRFVVSDKGEIKKVKILRGIGSGCDESVKKLMLSMNNMEQKWIPGSQDGKKVNVFYTMPVIFKLKNIINKNDIEENKK